MGYSRKQPQGIVKNDDTPIGENDEDNNTIYNNTKSNNNKKEKEKKKKTGNYNKSPYDRTKWYALNKMIYSIYANGEMKITKRVNENTQNVEPIPYINTDDKPNYKPDNKKEKGKKKVTELDKIIESYTSNSELIETLQDFLKMRKAQKKVMTDRLL